jgi:hypothetical protein
MYILNVGMQWGSASCVILFMVFPDLQLIKVGFIWFKVLANSDCISLAQFGDVNPFWMIHQRTLCSFLMVFKQNIYIASKRINFYFGIYVKITKL